MAHLGGWVDTRGLRQPAVRPNHLAAPWRRSAPCDVPPPWSEGFGIPKRGREIGRERERERERDCKPYDYMFSQARVRAHAEAEEEDAELRICVNAVRVVVVIECEVFDKQSGHDTNPEHRV